MLYDLGEILSSYIGDNGFQGSFVVDGVRVRSGATWESVARTELKNMGWTFVGKQGHRERWERVEG